MQPARSLVRLLPALAAAAVFVAACAITRIAIALRPEVAALDAGDLTRGFAYGLGFDFAAAAYAIAPFTLWLMLAPGRIAGAWIYRAASVAWFFAACFAALLLGVSEWLFWDEFGGRFNFIAVDYLLYTHEVLANIWQSYPTGKLLVAIALAAAVLTALLARSLWRWSAAPAGWRQRSAVVLALILVLAGLTRFVEGDDKNFSTRDTANELAGNGLYEFFSALRRNELSFERYYATLPLDEALATVRGAFGKARWIKPEGGGIERFEPGGGAERKLNVVLVSVESLGAEFLGAYGDPRGLTPNLDRLAKESLWFSRVYATGNRTVRGLEALALSLPPTPGQSIVRRPNNEKLFSLGSVFEDKDYAVMFAYGGYGYFDNMNAFFAANHYRVVDRRAIPSERIEFENVWGVADEHLYDQVIAEIDRDKAAQPQRPVFVHVMTTSNHRPYTYPGGRIDIPSGSGREGAVKYTDYALGQLIERARARPWFKDTVFVITADHGASARGTTRIPVDKYLIPVFVYAPAHIAPQRVDRLMSQIDIAPTLLGLLDFSYHTKFLGRDVLHSAPQTDRAFIGNFQTLAFMKDNHIAVLEPKRKTGVYRLDEKGAYFALAADPAFTREAIAFYQVASHVFRNGLYLDEEQLDPADRVAAAALVPRR
ncbi:MAG: LTA synthase family protein [Betaproteobacteria bacterium]